MTHRSVGEFTDDEFDSEITGLLDEARDRKTAEKEAESLKSQRLSLITDCLKSPDSPVICLSYPDGSRNEAMIKLIKSGQLDGVPSDLDTEEVIDNEKSLYSAMTDLFDVSDNFEDERFAIISDGKKQLIATWMNMRGLTFSSNWVSFLRDILPGGDVSEEDIDIKTYEIVTEHREYIAAREKIASLLADEYGLTLYIDGATIREKANNYLELALIIFNKIMSDNITKGELTYQTIQLQAKFALSSATQLECLRICAELCDIDIREYI